MKQEGVKVIARNRRASHEYELLERFEAGLVLTGSEIKSIRIGGTVSLQEAYVLVKDREAWVVNMHISEYKQAAMEGHQPMRPRKLLLHRKEIIRIINDVQKRGYTVVPTQLHLSRGRAKLEIALARGKKLHDKRQSLRERDDEKRMERALKEYR